MNVTKYIYVSSTTFKYWFSVSENMKYVNKLIFNVNFKNTLHNRLNLFICFFLLQLLIDVFEICNLLGRT